MPEAYLPYIPENIIVHLASPQSSAENVTISFPEYIKNVASSELYPTWREEALRANILAQISFALNRIYTEFYRSQGYDFDITNSTSVDQAFIKGRDIFENVGRIVDEIFNSYIVRQGNVEPLFASYCNGTTTVCEGMSQWGSVELAAAGLTPYEILQNYYGSDISIVNDTPVGDTQSSAPQDPLRLGSVGNEVRQLQLRINRISKNYPGIPKIIPVSGVFTASTEDAVKKFQEVFDLAVDGVVGNATWYRVLFLYNGVKRLNELASEGLAFEDVSKQFPDTLRLGDEGLYVSMLQYFLTAVGDYYSSLPPIAISGTFDENTQNAVFSFQRRFSLPITGVVDLVTWNDIYDTYLGIIESLPVGLVSEAGIPFPGEYLALGSSGEAVTLIQNYLDTLATVYPSITPPAVSGIYSTQTEAAVREFQRLFELEENGIVGPITWDEITDQYMLISEGNMKSAGQFAQNIGGQR